MDPKRLGPYTIRGRLGRGGMGTVYEAEDEAGTVVAVKTLSAHLGDDGGLRRRFEVEIGALETLRHPGIVRLLAFGEEDGRPFFAMELVRGQSLEEILKTGRRFDWRETVAIATEITRALKFAHDQGIVHRDIKPANLLFPTKPVAEATVKLADFGIARLFGDSGHTQAGVVVGTADYMAPEQAMGGPVDARVDLYSLGLVIFAMIAGRPPFRGSDVSEVLRRQRRETPPRLSAIVPEVPTPLDELVARLLAKDPAARPANALAVGRALAAIGDAGEPAAPGGGLAGDVGGLAAGDSGPAPADRAADPNTQDGGFGPTITAAADTGVDLLAATRAGRESCGAAPGEAFGSIASPGTIGVSPTLPFTSPTSGEPRSLPHRPTEPHGLGVGQASAEGNRFTTVEEMHLAIQAEAHRAAWRDGLLRSGLAAALLAVVFTGGYAVLKPITADQLHERILAILEDHSADTRDARPLIDLFLARFPDDPRARAIRGMDHDLDLDALERRARRRPVSERALSSVERDYRAAMARESESPLACLAALEAILVLHKDELMAQDESAGEGVRDPHLQGDDAEDLGLWRDLVHRQILRIGPLADRVRAEDLDRAAATLAEAAAFAAEAEQAPEALQASLLTRRRQLLAGLVEIYRLRPHATEPVAEAQRLLDAIGNE